MKRITLKKERGYITIEDARRMIAGVDADDFDKDEWERNHIASLASSVRAAANRPGMNLANLAKTTSRYIENHKNTKHATELAALIAARDSLHITEQENKNTRKRCNA